MSFWKTIVGSGFAQVIRIMVGVLQTKVLAVYLGPPGVALMGQLTNAVTIVSQIGTGGISAGIVNCLSRKYDDKEQCRDFIFEAVRISLVLTGIVAVALISFSSFWSKLLLFSDQYAYVFVVIGIGSIFLSFQVLILAVLNGLRMIKRLVVLQIIGNIASGTVVIILAVVYGISGVLIATILSQSCIVVITVCYFRNSSMLRSVLNSNLTKFFNIGVLKEYAKYSQMTIVSMLVAPVSQMFIRSYISDSYSLDQAGILQALWSVSNAYTGLFTSAFSTYYFPKLSSLKTKTQMLAETKKTALIVMMLMIVFALCIFVMRHIVIDILYSSKFYSMADLLIYQLVGDVIRMLSWVLGLLMIIRAMTFKFVVAEIYFAIQLIGIMMIVGCLCSDLRAVLIATIINNCLYLVYVLWVNIKFYGKSDGSVS